MLRRTFLFPCVLAVLAFAAGPALATQYTITDLGELPPLGEYVKATDINASGQISGYTENPEYMHAFRWDSGAMTDLGVPSNADTSRGLGINDDGKVVGYANCLGDGTPGAAYNSAVISNGSGGLNYLLVDGATPIESKANAINNHDIVVGQASFGASSQAFHYDMEHNILTNLGASEGYLFSEACDVNNAGDVLGFAYTSSFAPAQFLYSGGSMIDLSTLITGISGVSALNDDGWIVGSGSTANYASGGFLYNKTTSVDLGLAAGSDGTIPTDINNLGVAVGYSTFDRDPLQAMIYDGSSVSLLYDLLDASGQAAWTTLTSATAVNDAGLIVGYGTTAGGDDHAFLLTPVPEPSTVALSAFGLIGLLCYAWRKRK